MASVDAVLAEIDTILSDRSQRPADARESVRMVVGVRSKVVKLIAQLTEATAEDPHFKANPDAARQFSERLADARRMLAGLQAKWRMEQIEQDFPGYSVESRPVGAHVVEFVAWARSSRVAA